MYDNACKNREQMGHLLKSIASDSGLRVDTVISNKNDTASNFASNHHQPLPTFSEGR